MEKRIKDLITFYRLRIAKLKETEAIEYSFKKDAIFHYEAFIKNLEMILDETKTS